MSNKVVSAPPVTPMLAVFTAVAAWTPVLGQTPAQDGQWSPVFNLPLIAIHSAILPTGRVFLFSAEHGVPGVHGWLFDPESIPGTPALTEVAPPPIWNPDCAGHSFLPDGRLLVAGGTLGFNPTRGPKLAYLFDPYAEQWVRVEDMRQGRWYPTNITLPDGRIMTLSGLNDTTGQINPDVELWDANGTSNWELLGQKTVPYYPYLHLLPSGLVFRAGPDAQTETYNVANNTWTPVATTNAAARYEAPCVLLPPTLNRVMLIGGVSSQGALPTNSVEIIDFSSPTPAWSATAHMAFRRMKFNAVLLPDGQVLVIGGESGSDPGPDQPVFIPEIYNPATSTWKQLAAHQIRRMYHSTAILLPDARVLVAGGDFQPTGEIYSPPYLFAGPRPGITAAPGYIAYGSPFKIGFTSPAALNSVVLIPLSSVTHSVNMGQRYVLLTSNAAGGSDVSVPGPANANLAPPGFYMLFVVTASGVPSISKIVRVGRIPGDFDADGDVDQVDFAHFQACRSGAELEKNDPACIDAHLDGDSDVDLEDLGIFQRCIGGADVPAVSGCAG